MDPPRDEVIMIGLKLCKKGLKLTKCPTKIILLLLLSDNDPAF